MHWCSGTVQSDALQLSPRILAASLIGNPWYSPTSGPPPRSGPSSCCRAAHPPSRSTCAPAGATLATTHATTSAAALTFSNYQIDLRDSFPASSLIFVVFVLQKSNCALNFTSLGFSTLSGCRNNANEGFSVSTALAFNALNRSTFSAVRSAAQSQNLSDPEIELVQTIAVLGCGRDHVDDRSGAADEWPAERGRQRRRRIYDGRLDDGTRDALERARQLHVDPRDGVRRGELELRQVWLLDATIRVERRCSREVPPGSRNCR